MHVNRSPQFKLWGFALGLWCLGAAAQPAPGDGGGNAPIQITLKNDFINTYRNRATISDVSFLVDKAHDAPNPATKDGDLHVAGRATVVGLPMVAELMNAKSKKPLVTLFNAREDSTQPLVITGVWRLWAEHGGIDPQTQGDPVAPATTTNPHHVFQIHPITAVDQQSVLDTLRGITGFKYKVADDAFQRYESVSFHVECGVDTTTFRTKMVGFNYVDFEIGLLEDPTHLVEDGLSIYADIFDPIEDGLIVHKRRIWFVKGSGPYNKVLVKHADDHLRVIGVPRISLSLLAWRCAHATERPEVLDWNLPYEMVVVATKR
jgi:hypothetical protein